MKKKKLLRFVALISLIVLSMNVDLFARGGDPDDPNEHVGPDDGGGITCGRYEGPCWALNWISPIIYIHCYFSGYQKDSCYPG